MKVFPAFDHIGINHSYQKLIWTQGIRSMGWEISDIDNSDLTIMWGPNPEFDYALERKKPVLMIDFPYWNRGGKVRDGNEFYKVSLNGQHPTPFLFEEKHSADRYIATGGPQILPWKKDGKHIVLAGIGLKAQLQYGYEIGGWETKAAKLISKQTKMPIIYRPKPNQKPIIHIDCATLDLGELPIEQTIEGAHCVVCHHGNPTVQALAMGVPIFMNGLIGAASHLASFKIDEIMNPIYPDNRQEFFNNLSHWQWSVAEIKNGAALKSYKDRGFI